MIVGASFYHVLLGALAIVPFTPNPLNIGDKPTASADGLSPRVSRKSAQRSRQAFALYERSAYQLRRAGIRLLWSTNVAQNRRILLTRGVMADRKPLYERFLR